MLPVPRTPCAALLLAAGAIAAPASAQKWEPLRGSVAHDRETAYVGWTATPRVTVLWGLPAVTYSRLGAGGGRVATKLHDGQDWRAVGEEPAGAGAPDWWGHTVQTFDLRTFRAAYTYGNQPDLSGGTENGLELREFDHETLSWETVVAPRISTGQAHTPDLVPDGLGRLLIAYQDGPLGNGPGEPQGSMTVARVDPGPGVGGGGTVEYLGGAGFSDALVPTGKSSVWTTSVAVAPDGTLWASWDERNGIPRRWVSRAMVARYVPRFERWFSIGGVGLGVDARGDNLALTLDRSGRPYVVVPTSAGVSHALQVYALRADGDGWDPVGPPCGALDDPQVSTEAGYRDRWGIAIGPGGEIHLAYRANFWGSKVCVRRYDPVLDRWDLVGDPGFSEGGGADAQDDYVSIAFVGDVPIVACRHGRTAEAWAGPIDVSVYAFR